MIRFLMLLLVLGISSPSYAERIFTEVSGSSDSDDARSLGVFAGYRDSFSGPGRTEVEFAGGQRTYSEPGERETFNVGRLRLDSRPGRNWRMQLGCEFLNGEDWSPALPAAFLSSQLNEDWYFELSAERTLVDSVSAVRRHISVDSYVASADYRLNDRLTLAGAYIAQYFSDDNRKRGGIGRVIYSPEQLPGVNLQIKGRVLRSEQDSPDYFSPQTLVDGFLLFGYAKAFADDNWVVKLLAGPGAQRVEPFNDGARNKSGYHGELSLQGWFNDHIQLVSRLGCTSADDTQEAYSYCFGRMRLEYAW
ncbi:MAG: hypothetical protein RQ754_05030 [Desulfuromonadales bacterium]|nr:hypothetical protein [Desulfuromonadales bacterium]